MKDLHTIKEVSLIRKHKNSSLLPKKTEPKDSSSLTEQSCPEGPDQTHEDFEEIMAIARGNLFGLGPKIQRKFGEDFECYE